MNEHCQVLLHAVPAASGAICVGAQREGRGGESEGADDFNVLEPQTDLFPRQSAV